MKTLTACTAFAALVATPLIADEFTPAIENFYQSEVANWSSAQVLIDAINTQNGRTAAYDQARIDELDLAWRAEVGAENRPTIDPVLQSAAADFLRGQIEASGGRITEVFIMDARGLNVAASDVTSDFWQGDEAKFSETYPKGPESMHVSDVELDDSTQRYQGQLSVTITDPATGAAIGAMTVGVDAEALM